jgi:isopentenyl diphosphate isomerase/L-lactate dehydrogenase-like FMN-dependent dehydrogenase
VRFDGTQVQNEIYVSGESPCARPYVYALAVGGENGVAAFPTQLAAETDVTLALVGTASVDELDESWIAASS